MDINSKIIEGVAQSPSLHNNNGNLNERNHAWLLLAEKLRMPEQILKIRWHSLLQGYQREANFKYASNMHFVCRNAETETNVENWPEFIITEEDLKDDNQEPQEEFVFLEADEEDNKNFMQESPREKESQVNKLSKEVDEIPNKDFKNEDQDISDAKTSITDVKSTSEQYIAQIEDAVEIATNKSKERDISSVTTLNVEQKMAAVHVNKNYEPLIIRDFKEVAVEKSQPLIAERCEDVIFGELVSAMLKRMEENKKKNIKREIMNILFS